jgi:hypothetical protein
LPDAPLAYFELLARQGSAFEIRDREAEALPFKMLAVR